jgi:hypothetical protein
MLSITFVQPEKRLDTAPESSQDTHGELSND